MEPAASAPSVDGKVSPINALPVLRGGDAKATRAYLHDVFMGAAKERELPMPEYVFGLQHVIDIFYGRTRSDKQAFVPWFYIDDVLEDVTASLQKGQIVKPVGFADTVVFEQAWDPRQHERMAVFKPLVEAIYGAAHNLREGRLGPVSAYSQLHERLDQYLGIASAAADTIRKSEAKQNEARLIVIVQSEKELF